MSESREVFRQVPRTGVIFVMNEAQAAGYMPEDASWINLGQGAPQTGPLPGAPARLPSVSIDAERAEYAPVPGRTDLREAIAALYNARYRRGMKSQYTAHNVAIASGGRAALTRVAATLGSINLGHVLPDYTAYEELLTAFRAFVPIPVVLREDTGFELGAQQLESEIVGKGLGALLFSNPANPTGHVLAGAPLAESIGVARKLGCALIIDEFYAHYIYDTRHGETVSAAAHVEDVDHDPVVIVDGLTKNWRYPGLRLSWTVGPREVIERISSAGSFLDGGAAHAIQSAAIGLVARDAADQEAAAIRAEFGAKRDLLSAGLRELGMTLPCEPAGAFYCFANLGQLPEPLRDGMTFFRRALAHKLICVPGEFFDVNPGKRRSHIPSRMRSYVRLSFGPDQASVREGLLRLRALVQEAAAGTTPSTHA